jgi:alpha-1,6-mannosyltransferase
VPSLALRILRADAPISDPASRWTLIVCGLAIEIGLLAMCALADWQEHVVEFIALNFAVFLFYLVAVWVTSDEKRVPTLTGRTLALLVFFGLAFRLTLLPVFPNLSEDPLRYRWQGMLQVAGGNPYLDVPEDPQWQSLQDETWAQVTRKDLSSVYGPVYEHLHAGWQRVAYSLWPSDPYTQAWSYKLPYVFFELLAALALLWLLDGYQIPRQRALIWWWSPLVLTEYWGQGHNDPLAILFVLVAFGAAVRKRWPLAFAALTLATATKFWPLILFPFLLLEKEQNSWKLRWKPALISIPVALAVSLPYLRDISNVSDVLKGFVGGWRNNDSLYGLIYNYAGQDFDRGTEIVTYLLATGLIAIWSLRWERSKAALAAIALLLFLSANCFPWYLGWFLPLLALRPNSALLLWTGLVPLAYNILIPYGILGDWQELEGFRALEYWPVYGLLLAGGVSSLFFWRGPGIGGTRSDSSRALPL